MDNKWGFDIQIKYNSVIVTNIKLIEYRLVYLKTTWPLSFHDIAIKQRNTKYVFGIFRLILL